MILAFVALAGIWFYAEAYENLHDVPGRWADPNELLIFCVLLGIGLVARLADDTIAGVSQALDRLKWDQLASAGTISAGPCS